MFIVNMMVRYVKLDTQCFRKQLRLLFDAMAKSANLDYQKLQYFISDFKWDMQVMLEADSLRRTIKQKRLLPLSHK